MIVYNVKHLQYASKIFLLIIYNYLKNNENPHGLLIVFLFLTVSTSIKAQDKTANNFNKKEKLSMPSIVQDSTAGFRMQGLYPNGRLGYAVSNIGDINNDGFDDVSVCAPYCTPETTTETGEIYVIFGGDSGFGATLDIGQLDGSNGFRVRGMNAEDRLGYGGARTFTLRDKLLG